MAEKRVHIIVSGRVQGVGYRFFTRNTAYAHNLTGWVRNLHDHTVETEAQGEERNIEAFVSELTEGPPFGHVSDLVRTEMPLVSNEDGFRIVY